MRFAVCLLIALAAFAAKGSPVFDNGWLQVVLTEEECDLVDTYVELMMITGVPSKKASILNQGTKIRACWTEQGDNVIILDEYNNGGFLARASFLREASLR